MKKIILCMLMISVCMFIFLSGCTEACSIDELYKVTYNNDFTYDYVIKDRSNNVLLSDKNVSRQPEITVITKDLLRISVQTGTGISTCWTVYCDVTNGKTSEPYYSVLGEEGENVVYVNYNSGTYSVVVQSMFNQEQLREAILVDASKVADPVVSFEKTGNGKAKLIYLKGETWEETSVTIDLQ